VAFVWGISSGAALALEAATRLDGIRKLALYEAPFIVDDSRPATAEDWDRINDAVGENRWSDAIRLFLDSVGLPGFIIRVMQLTPIWSKLKAVAHTLPYDGAIVRDNQQRRPLSPRRWASVTAPTLVMSGGKSAAWMRRASESLATVLPNAQHRTLQGQTHKVNAKAHSPLLVEFFRD
jgi:pimeloyl-ACP methyl ester carboxylesterase